MGILLIMTFSLIYIRGLSNTLLIEENKLREQQEKIIALQEAIEELKNPKNGVKYNGALRVVGTELVNKKGEAIQLRGLSSHGIMWFPEFTNYRAIATTKKYGANVFRIALYTEQENGYIYNPDEAKKLFFMALENTLGADMYAIVDWHTLKDENPNQYVKQAMAFFDEVSARYAHEPGVIYEICNEPSGDTTWEEIKEYAHKVIPVIRKNAPDAIILVGTPKFCTDIKKVAEDPLDYKNILYTYHLYTAYNEGDYKEKIEYVLEEGIPLFVSEWGINHEKEEDAIAYEKAEAFLDFLNEKNISWVNWSLCNKQEEYSVISPSSSRLSNWAEKDLTENGRFIMKALGKGK